MQNLKDSLPNKILLIGASTGGPGIIENIIYSLENINNTSIIVAQHMATDFTPSFIKRLQEHTLVKVCMAEHNMQIQNAKIYFCQGNTTVQKDSNGFKFIVEPSLKNRYNPDINSIFTSFAKYTKDVEIFAVILTGIGDDGVNGCAQLSLNGARTSTQDKQSAIVDGMPCRARESVKNIEICNTQQIKQNIKEFCS